MLNLLWVDIDREGRVSYRNGCTTSYTKLRAEVEKAL